MTSEFDNKGEAIRLLLAVARAADEAMENTQEDADGGPQMGAEVHSALCAALSQLESELPDDRPGYVMSGPAKAEWALHSATACSAVAEIAAERQRQKDKEGWSEEHDDKHADGSLAEAAACYAAGNKVAYLDGCELWPWEAEWWKPKDKRRNLIRAAALLVAEIERMDRAMLRADESTKP